MDALTSNAVFTSHYSTVTARSGQTAAPNRAAEVRSAGTTSVIGSA